MLMYIFEYDCVFICEVRVCVCVYTYIGKTQYKIQSTIHYVHKHYITQIN